MDFKTLVFKPFYSFALCRLLFSYCCKISSFAVKYFLIYLLVFLPINIAIIDTESYVSKTLSMVGFTSSIAYAAEDGNLPIAPDGSTNTNVIAAANGVDVVNISAPTGASRVSRNNFSDYNVNPSGLIINNASVVNYGDGAYRTEIVGWINANANLRDSGAANVILNQVTSNRITQINGFTEIAGKKADLIIANPNGISVNGGGFINTDRLSLVVGSEISESEAGIDGGNPAIGEGVGDLYFRITSIPHIESGFLPTLTISGNGIDLTRVNRSEFVANLIRITGDVYAGDNDVSFLAGDDVYNYSNNTVTSNDSAQSSSDPSDQIAIDASALSQIQAGNIFMVSTKEGFGVKYSGEMIANLGIIDVNANGDIEFEGNNTANSIDATSQNGDVNLRGNNVANSVDIEAVNGDITNHDGAELIVGSGGLILRALNGNINQLSENGISVDGNFSSWSYNLTNDGLIEASGDLIINTTNDLINESNALIYSGRDMFLNIGNNLTNNEGAAIYAYNDLTIRRLDPDADGYDATDNNMNQIDNIAATIESGSNMTINANVLNNTGIDYDPDDGGFYGYNRNNEVYVGPRGEGGFALMSQDEIVSTLRTRQSSINAGGNITINNSDVHNYSSLITAQGNVTMNGGSLNNETSSILVEGLRRKYGNHYTTKHCKFHGSCKTYHHYPTYTETYTTNAVSSEFGVIKAGGNIALNGTNTIDNGYLEESLGAQIAVTNPLTIPDLLENGSFGIDFNSHVAGEDNQGLFQKNDNPNSPIFESRSQFVNQDEFFASDYFYESLGVDLVDFNTQLEQNNQRMIGDQFFQAKIVEQQLKNITKNSFLLSQSETNPNSKMKSLIDNAAAESTRLGLDVNTSLTQSQVDSLQEDILWYEIQEIDGDTYVVPKIYLSQATRAKLRNDAEGNKGLIDGSLIYAKNDVSVTTTNGGINNGGSIIAGNNVVLSASLAVNAAQGASSNITNNNYSEIKAGNDLTITAGDGSIINRSVIASDSDNSGAGNLTLSAANNVFNLATVGTNASNLLAQTYGVDGSNNGDGDATISAYVSNGAGSRNSGDIRSAVFETASLAGQNVTINTGKDFTNVGSGVESAGNLAITAGDDINVETVKFRNRSEVSWGGKKKGGTRITDVTSNVGSDIVSGGDLRLTTTGLGIDGESGTSNLDVGSSIIVTGSDLTATGDLALNANNNAIITNAVDTNYFYAQTTKRGSTRKSVSTRTDYVESAVSSNLTAKNIDITANNNILIQGSNTNSNFDDVNDLGGDTQLTAGNDVIISNAILNEYHHASRTVSNRGAFKAVTAVTSIVIDYVVGIANLTGHVSSITLSNLDDPLQRIAKNNPLIPSKLVDRIDANYLEDKNKERLGNDSQYHNTKVTTTVNRDLTNIVASNVNAGDDLTITAIDDVTVQGSNLRAGTAEYASTALYDVDKANGANENATVNDNITGALTVNANDLSVLAASSYDVTATNKRTKRTNTIKTNISNDVNVNYTDSTLAAKGDDFAFNVNGEVNVAAKDVGTDAVINAKSGQEIQAATPPPAYLAAIQRQIEADIVNKTRVRDTYVHTDATVRQLTDVGTATVAIAAVAAVVVTAGAASAAVGGVASAGAVGVGAAAGGATAATVGTMAAVGTTAVMSAAAATAAVTATSASMNTENDGFGQAEDVANDTWDATTSRDAMESYAIAFATAALTAGIMEGTGLNEAARNADGVNSAASSGSGVSGIDGVGTINGNAANASNLSATQRFGIALAESTVSNGVSVATQSAINGESFSDAMSDMARNIVIGAVSNMAAKEIGEAVHGDVDDQGYVLNNDGTRSTFVGQEYQQIGRPTQMVLHGALGCASGAASGGDCASGAVSGMTGELAAEFADQSLGLNRQQSIEFAGLAGGFSTIFTGNVVGLSDSEIAQNIYIGSRVGKNAGENNALSPQEYMDEQVDNMWLDGDISDEQRQEYKQVILQNEILAGEILLTGATLVGGSILLQGGKAIGKNVLGAKLASATVNGVSGASGGAWGAYVGGGDMSQILNSAGAAGLIGAGTGFLFNGSSFVNGVSSGAGSGLLFSVRNTYLTNPNATGMQYLNNGLEGAFGGAVVGATTILFTPANSGLAGQIIGAQTALPVNLITGTIFDKYDILPINNR